MGHLDTGSKKVINIYNQAWAEWVLQQQQVTVEAELSGEFQFVARATDSLLQVTTPNGRFLVLTELQFLYDPTMPKRLAAYAILARQKYGQDVYVVVIYFMPPADDVTIEDVYHREFMGQVVHQDFQPIKLWDLEAEAVLAYGNPALLPFVPLMKGGNNERMVRRCAERIRQEPQAAELETVLAIFAEYVLDKQLLKQILRWEMNIVQKSTILQELIEKGREEGEETGQRRATLDNLYQTLTIRFNADPNQYHDQLNRLDLPTLKNLFETALTAPSLAEFEAALTDLLTPPDTA